MTPELKQRIEKEAKDHCDLHIGEPGASADCVDFFHAAVDYEEIINQRAHSWDHECHSLLSGFIIIQSIQYLLDKESRLTMAWMLCWEKPADHYYLHNLLLQFYHYTFNLHTSPNGGASFQSPRDGRSSETSVTLNANAMPSLMVVLPGSYIVSPRLID